MNKIIFIIILIILFICATADTTTECMSKSKSEETNDYIGDMPTFIINLKNRPDRKNRVLKKMNDNGLTGTFIEAINGNNLQIDGVNIDQIYKKNNYRQLRKGEIGCYLSHLVCWNLIAKSGKPYGLVLEDDVVFIDNFKYIFNNVFKEIKDKEWDVIALGRRCNKKIFDEDCVKGTMIYDNTFYPDFIGYSTFAYIIKTDTINKLLKTTFPFTKPIDVVLIDEQQKGNIKIIAFVENLVGIYSLADSDTISIK